MIKCIIFVFSLVFVFMTHGTDGYYYSANYITVPVDHFSYTNGDTFELKYLMNDTYWDVEKGPIFFYTGNEASIETFAENTGLMWDLAPEFKALVVFAEHRYYGESKPYGAQSFYDPKYLGYLTTQQALADFVDLIQYLQRRGDGRWSGKLPIERPNPVIAFGGSYGGMLAAWLRMKYPANVVGAIASSAPIWYFNGMTPCNDIFKMTTEVYKHENAECASIISASWKAIDNETKNGETWLMDNWRLCAPLNDANDVTLLKHWVAHTYVELAMLNYPYETNFMRHLPAYPVKEICKSLTKDFFDDRTLLANVFRGLNVYFNYTGSAKCMDLSSTLPKDNVLAWKYQGCTELTTPLCMKGGEEDMFDAFSWNSDAYAQYCKEKFDVTPVVDALEKQYGGKNLRGASRIIFSNGQLDPWYGGGVLNNMSPTLRALLIPDAAHHFDLRAANPNDPPSVISARKKIKRWIKVWIYEYTEYKYREY